MGLLRENQELWVGKYSVSHTCWELGIGNWELGIGDVPHGCENYYVDNF
ncbi:MAG: hypothetical protein F6K47_06495 [Symploca sp. SIO2E6]|nr:hypothetical protein [Symploca sp. SIO2E6]